MSFFDNLGGMLGKLTGADPSDVADAATDHVEGMDAGQLADHLKNSIPNMDSSSLGGLAQSVMSALSAHGHDESTINDSGVDTADAIGRRGVRDGSDLACPAESRRAQRCRNEFHSR